VTTQSITIRLPDPIYQQLKRRADRAGRSLEDELLEVVVAAVPVADEPSDDLAEAISPLAALDDQALWRVARDRLPTDTAEQLQSLDQKRQREGLTEAEEQEAAALLQQYERLMLVRAHAVALLKQRGHDVSSLLTAA
jgi:plasmid stability protein